MDRATTTPRIGWESIVEKQGLGYHRSCHSPDLPRPYWDESVHYVFTLDEVLHLEEQVEELHRMCLSAVDFVVKERRYLDFAMPAWVWPAVEASWKRRDHHIFGRFDVRYTGDGSPIKLLEYNADTPTALIESSIVQWYWLKDRYPEDDQWNSIHERLVEAWKQTGTIRAHFGWTNRDETGEEAMTVAYLQETADQAGIATTGLAMEDIGWDPAARRFVDVAGEEIHVMCKLYPWEWVVGDAFGQHAVADLREAQPAHTWFEPVWKMLLSNKAILAILWELFPGHPNLLPAYLREPGPLNGRDYIAKPLLGREGAAMRVEGSHRMRTPGDYGAEGFVYQEFSPLPDFDGQHPVLGCWMVEDEAAGLGIRETSGLITDDTSSFVPHRIAMVA